MPASKPGIWRNPRHGTATGYINYGCRCSDCRAWNAQKQRNYRRRNPERTRAYARSYMRRNPEKARRAVLRKYGITSKGYERLLVTQGGVCAICLHPPKDGTALHVDHDHRCCEGQRSCGRCIRGLLCSKCNTVLGYLADEPARFMRAAAYLNDYDTGRA